jgi:hypothetical protein
VILASAFGNQIKDAGCLPPHHYYYVTQARHLRDVEKLYIY